MVLSGLQRFADHFILTPLRHTGREVNILQVVLVGVLGGLIGGFSSTLYHFVLDYAIEVIWKYLFEALKHAGAFTHFPEYNFIWMGSFLYITFLVLYLRFFSKYQPGGFGVGVEKLHVDGNVPPAFYFPMFFCSLMSLASGSGVGPEAPVMVLGGASSSFVAKKLGLPKRAMRLFVLSSICGAHSAFFGSPITGIFGLESVHALGLEYFEALYPGLIASMIGGTLLTSIYGRNYGAIFEFENSLETISPIYFLHGILLGLVGGLVAFYFFAMGRVYAAVSKKLGLHRFMPFLPYAAWVAFSIGGMLLPPILFWGEPEFRNVISRNGIPLHHYEGSSSGIIPLGETYSMWTIFAIGLTKLTILPFNISMNMRGGIVFPLFHIGGTFGQFVSMLTGIDQALAVTAVMAAAQGAITRTPLSSALVAVFNSKGTCPQLIIPAAIASHVALLVNYRFPVFPTQRTRDDIRYVDELPKEEPQRDESLPIAAQEEEEEDDSFLSPGSTKGAYAILTE